MLNSDNVPTLVEFSDTMRRLGPGMLQYIPAIVNAIKPGSPLVRNMVRLLARYEKLMDARTCSRLFSLQTILSMMKNKDANVRKVAVSLMGKKVLEKSKHIWVIIQMWGDKNNKVRKEVMEVLGDIGKTNPEYISHIMNLIDTDSVSSVLVWRFLSKSWGTLIKSVPMTAEDS
jgi:exoribonuclease R